MEAEEQVVTAEATEYVSEGQVVPARLFRPSVPANGSPRPAALLCTGRLREIDGLSFLAEALARAGMVVLATAYRGMDMRPDDQDCLDGLEHLTRLRGVDPERLAMVGHSRGAMAALRVAAKTDRVRAVVALQPVADLSAYVQATRAYSPTRYQALCRGMGDTLEEVGEAYVPLSAIHYATRIKAPVLLVAGTQDLHSPIDESIRMRDALVAAGNADARLEVLDGVGHFFERMYGGYQHEAVVKLTLDWLGSRLPPTDEPASAAAPANA